MTKNKDKFYEQLDQLRQEKLSTPPRKRRYSLKEQAMVLEAVKELGVTEVNRLSGIRTSTLHVWKRREQKANEPSYGKESEPHYEGHHPDWEKVIDLWKSRPGMGPAQICNQLKRQGQRIAVSTVRNILEENGYSPPRAKIKEERVFRYEAVRPRELVHMDFKHFYVNKQKVFLLLLQDDYSRFLCGYKLTDSENMEAVIECFEKCVNDYGRMQTIMTDAGSAFYSWNGLNRFQKLIAEEYGIDHIKASSPRSNGKLESVNKQIEKELFRVKHFSSIEEAGYEIEEWVEFYNFERTHMGLPQGEVPADRFLKSWNRKSQHQNQKKSNVWEDVLKVAIEKIK